MAFPITPEEYVILCARLDQALSDNKIRVAAMLRTDEWKAAMNDQLDADTVLIKADWDPS